MKVRDIMTRSVTYLKPDDTVDYAAHLMKEHDIGAIPVCEGDRVIGIVTDRDIAIRIVAERIQPTEQTVGNIMTAHLVTGEPDMDIQEAGRLMREHQVRRLPIMDNGELVGIVSLGDIAIEPQLEQEAGDILSEVSEPNPQKVNPVK